MSAIVHIAHVLDKKQIYDFRRAAERLTFIDGRSTAGWSARSVKNNRQAKPAREFGELQGKIISALAANETLSNYAMPSVLAPPLVSRTGKGEGYGLHIDDAIMGQRQKMRTDISVTLFLSSPDDYEGGELEITLRDGVESAKFAAGDAVLYPSSYVHQVRPVTKGERMVAVTWIQSLVRSAQKREILYDINCVRREIFARDGKSEAFDTLSKSHANLLRRWADI